MSRFDPGVIAHDPERRQVIVDLLDKAIEAVDPYQVTRSALFLEGGRLAIGPNVVELDDVDRVIVLGLGKAAAGMTTAVVDSFMDYKPTGLAVTAAPAPSLRGIDLIVGGHPVPDAESRRAGQALLDAAAGACERDLVVAVISGGGSSLAEVPVDGIGIDDIAFATDALLTAAVPIDQINAVRTRMSRLKGGGLAAAVSQSLLVTLVLSDVVGNPLHVVASGPTVVPPLGTGVSADVSQMLPEAMRVVVDAYIPPPRHERHIMSVVADGTTAAIALVEAARARDIPARLADEPLRGEARDAGAEIVAAATQPGIAAFVGETVVDVRGSGLGGRNQELALAAAMAADGDDTLLVAALATDGVDGPTTAAGGLIDGGSVERAKALGIDVEGSLANNDAHAVLEATGDLLVTGATGTNVADLAATWRI